MYSASQHYKGTTRHFALSDSCQKDGQHYFILESVLSLPEGQTRQEPYLPLPSQPKLVLIYRPRRDGRLSWPWLADCSIREVQQLQMNDR